MRVQLIAKRESGMTGTSRYTADLCQGFTETGLNVELTYPVRPRIPAVIQNTLNVMRLDPQAFFASYPLRASLNGADIYHLTGQMLATLLLFQRFPKPVVVTVLDIIPYLVQNLPELNTFRHPADKVFYRLALAGLRRANGLIAISNYTKKTLVETLKVPEKRIDVVYPGVDMQKFYPFEVPAAFWGKYGLHKKERYILFVGSEDPRKNLSTLILAYSIIKQQMPDVRLVKVGAAHYKQERLKLQESIRALNLQRDVLFLNYVPDEDLPCFYNAAEVLVMPSFYEGFGLPVVEAMACGTPVVCSPAGSLPEVTGQAGIYVDPTDPKKIADTLLTLLDNPKERLRMRQAGEQQAARFSLRQTACATRDVYSKLLNSAFKKESTR